MEIFAASVAKCRGSYVVHGSWVVGRGCVSWVWVWVNVVGKKSLPKKIEITKIKKQKVVKFMKRKSPSTYQSYPAFPW